MKFITNAKTGFKLVIPLYLFLTCFLFSCKKDSPSQLVSSKGSMGFWVSNGSLGIFPVRVSVNGADLGNIGARLSSIPSCSDYNNIVRFQASPGIYNLTATAANGGNWNGSFTIKEGGCDVKELQ